MFACRSGVTLILISLLSACAGRGDDRAAAEAPTDAALAKTSGGWGCFEPQPEHPTEAEKRAFLEEVAPLASRAEEDHGVPATAITAMAILESGYGWTRLAQNTNNLMGWKYFPQAAGEREFWVLECPEQGTSDQLLVFRDRAEAIDYVAEQLATSDNYRADTERYVRDRASGVDVVEAVTRWVDGIADPYSTQPEAYRESVRRIMNEPYALAEGQLPEGNLYSLSEAVSPGREQAAQALGG
jgi:Mannosyl-glycoprotein endo-beta-N-acetylglucosaminidase